MNKQDIIKDIKNNMPNFIGSEEEIYIKKALYIYVYLGKIKSFDEKYYFGNSKTKKKIYELAQREQQNIEQVYSKRKIICVSLTHMYCDILKEFGINAVASIPDEDGHIYPIIIEKNGNAFVADLQLDLENIQTKSRLQFFGYKEDMQRDKEKKSNQQELTKLLIEIGYIKNENDYKDEQIQKLAEQVKDMKPHDALFTILNSEELYSGNEEMEDVELNKFYIKILKKIMPNYLNRKIYVFNCYREKQNSEKEYTICIFSEDGDIKPYLFSKRDKKFLSVDIKKMDELQKEGLVLGAKYKETGSNKLKKYIRKYMETVDMNQEYKSNR